MKCISMCRTQVITASTHTAVTVRCTHTRGTSDEAEQRRRLAIEQYARERVQIYLFYLDHCVPQFICI